MEVRTFELEFAKFIQRFHEQICEAFWKTRLRSVSFWSTISSVEKC